MTWGWLFPVGLSWITAASTGAISAWVLNLLRDIWSRPRLRLSIDHSAVVEMQEPPQRYARLTVRNEGRSLAKGCCALVDYIKRTDPTGAHWVFHNDLLDLKWSALLSDTTILNVASGGYRLLDVGVIFIPKESTEPRFSIPALVHPIRLLPELRMNAEYEVHIRAYGDNAAPAEFSCRMRVGRSLSDLTIERCDDPRPPQERGAARRYLRPFGHRK
jgi:hypothetical protein